MAKILVIDDRPTNRQYLATLLGYYGHEIHEASNGAEGLDLVRKINPELAITDILMPGMDGYQFVQGVRADAALPQPRLVFYTASYSAPAAREMAKMCGVDAVVMKPCEPAEMMAVVNGLLGISETVAGASAPVRPYARPGMSALPADYNLEKYIARLQVTKRSFDKAVVRSVKSVLERELAEMLSEEFAADIADLRRLLFRLTVLIEVSTETAAERDPARIVEIFFGAACEILPCQYAAAATFDETDRNLRHLFAKDVPLDMLKRNPLHGALGALASGRCRTLRWNDAGAHAGELPPDHPACENFLGVAIAARGQTYGWLYFADRHQADNFSGEDERFASILAEKLALLYENAAFHDLMQRHAAQIQLESMQRAAAEAKLRESEQRFRQLAENVHDVFFLASAEGGMLYVNPAYELVWGRSCESLYADPRSWTEAVLDEDREATAARYEQALRSAGGFEMEFRIRRGDGQVRWIRTRGFCAQDGDSPRMAGIAEDITERKSQAEKIARLSRIREVLTGINSAIIRIHERGPLLKEACRIAVESGGFVLASVAMRNRKSGEIATATVFGADADLFGHSRDWEAGGDMAAEALRTGRPVFSNELAQELGRSAATEHMLQHGYRSAVDLPITCDGKVEGVLELCSREPAAFDADEMLLLQELAGDVSFALEFIAKSDRLDYLAYYDAMTDLPNATLFHDRLSQLVLGTTAETGKIAVICFDLDHFTDVNEKFGRHAGDLLLKRVATRLHEAQQEPSTLARVGANRFAIAVSGLRRSAEALDVVRERIFAPLAQPFPIDGATVQLSARAGIAMFPADGTDAGTLTRHAEAALKQRKGSDRFHYYSADANARITARLALEEQLREAIAKRQFILHYQPRVDLVSGLIVGGEALIRWQHPTRGLLDPDEFIPVAEQTGFIEPIGDWVIDAVCAQQSAWLLQYGQTVPIAINLSAMQMGKDDFLNTLQQALAGRDLDRKYLEVELTESAVMENLDDAMRTLSALRALGVALSLDDFGTGYSSLAYLKQFPFNFVKIDKSFIAGIVHNPEDAIIAKAIIALAHRLNLRVVAEGVETEAQLTYLRNNGCDEIQGFFFSRPVEPAIFGEMLQTGRRLELPPLRPGAPCTVLVVDGNAETLASLKRLLMTEGCEVLVAESGEQALDVLSVNAVQVIVCDQRMPGMSGTQFCSRVRSLYPDTVRIVLSGYADIEAVVDAMNRGVVYRFLTKPLDDRLLKAHVRDALRHYSAVALDEAAGR